MTAVTREDIRSVLDGILSADCTARSFLDAEDQLVALLGADPREVVFTGVIADWETPHPESGDTPKAVLDGQWLTDPAEVGPRSVELLAAAGGRA